MKALKLRGREKIPYARIASIFVLATLLLSCPLARAVPIIIEISGEVTSITSEYIDPLTDSIHVGDTFTGTYTYNTSTTDSDSSLQRGSYVHNSPYGVNISLGGYDFSTGATHTGGFVVVIEDDIIINETRDTYYIESSVNNALPSGFADYSIEWVISDSTHTALSSTDLPTTAPFLIDWDWYRFDVGGWEYVPEGDYFKGFYIQGIVTEAIVIPEPATLFLTMMGIFLVMRRR